MARITVEDCLEKVPNLFQLVLVAAKRAIGAHQIVAQASGAEARTVIAGRGGYTKQVY